MKKKMLVSLLVLAAFGLLLGLTPQSAVEDDIRELRQDVAELGLRLSKLEHASGSSQPAASSSSGSSAHSSGAPVHTMVLAAISQSAHPAGNDQEIARLQRKSDSLMSSVDQVSVQQTEIAGEATYAGRSTEGVRGWGGAAASSVVSTNVGSKGSQVLADQQLKERYSTEAYIAREKAKKLQAANAEHKQIIHGHNEHTIFTLETKRDLTEQLDAISIGDTVTWSGTRVDADETSETWVITSISKVGG